MLTASVRQRTDAQHGAAQRRLLGTGVGDNGFDEVAVVDAIDESVAVGGLAIFAAQVKRIAFSLDVIEKSVRSTQTLRYPNLLHSGGWRAINKLGFGLNSAKKRRQVMPL